jgi:hypothetical protein
VREMPVYKNLNGDSGVRSYEIGDDFIVVTFSRGKTYRWSYHGAGAHNVEQMKRLAEYGDGLNSYIMRNVKNLCD